MKNSILNYMILVCLCLCINPIKSINFNRFKYDSLACLQVEGKITNSDAGIDGECTVELICLNQVTKVITLKEGKKNFKFLLSKNAYYGIRISKKGYISKLVSINTEMLTDVDGVQKFEFETSLLSEEALSRLNKDAIDFPIAIIYFDYEQESFAYNKDYSSGIKKELYKKTGSAAEVVAK